MEEKFIYDLWLRLLRSVSDRKALRLIKELGSAEALFFADESRLQSLSYLKEEERSEILQKDLSAARAEAEACRDLGVFILTMNDPEYPKELCNLTDPPILFYGKGDVGLLSKHPKLTVVGTRRATPEGVSVTLKFARELAANGVVIVSGMADGIDGAAHSGALRARGKTIALLGCGIDVPYPVPNLHLKDEVGEKGLLLSEFPLGTPALSGNFPYRNRVLSALSEGTLVTEAGQGSGALITARGAVEEGKSVYALPWSIDHISGLGGNQLLKEGGAQMVLSPVELLRDLLRVPSVEEKPHRVTPLDRADTPVAAEPWGKRSVPKRVFPSGNEALSPNEAAILAALRHTDSVDRLIEETGIPAGELVGLLVMMEIKGLVRKEPGNRYIRKQEK